MNLQSNCELRLERRALSEEQGAAITSLPIAGLLEMWQCEVSEEQGAAITSLPIAGLLEMWQCERREK